MEEIDTFVVGDVHGRADLLRKMLDEFKDIAPGPYKVVFLGDLVDRGPDSQLVVDMALATVETLPGSRVIRGNHESVMMNFLLGSDLRAEMFQRWMCEHGGDATLTSYGMDPKTTTLETFRAQFRPDHLEFLRRSVKYVEMPKHILVHAGLVPGVPLAHQREHDLMWIREQFLFHTGPFEKLVIHGHTVTHNFLPEILENRIAIDTGAYASDVLTTAHIIPGQTLPELYLTVPGYPKVLYYNWLGSESLGELMRSFGLDAPARLP